jgi:hypothetical protein
MSSYGEGVGAKIVAVEIDPGPGGYFWELYAVHGCEKLNPSSEGYLASCETVEEVIAYANIAEAQVLLQSQDWYNANYDELTS